MVKYFYVETIFHIKIFTQSRILNPQKYTLLSSAMDQPPRGRVPHLGHFAVFRGTRADFMSPNFLAILVSRSGQLFDLGRGLKLRVENGTPSARN